MRPALRDQHAFGAAVWDDRVGGDAPRPVVDLGRGRERNRRAARVEDDSAPWCRAIVGRSAFDRSTRLAVDGQDVVLAGLGPPSADHVRSACRDAWRRGRGSPSSPRRRGTAPSRWSRCRSSTSLVIGAAELAALSPASAKLGPGQRADGAPAVVVDRAVAEHLVVLGVVLAGRVRHRRRCARSSRPGCGDWVTPRMRRGRLERRARPARSARCRWRGRTARAPRPCALMPLRPVRRCTGR